MQRRTRIAIDLESTKNSVFTPYKLKMPARMSLEDKIKPEKVGDLVAFLEYMGSRVIDEMTCREAGPNQYPFFDNEFDKEWLLDANDCEESINEIIEQNPERLFHEPVIISPVSGDPTKVSLVISPSCFEPDPEFMTQTRLQ